ncbi:MAG: TolC family protein [Salibacteraceae bacterium]
MIDKHRYHNTFYFVLVFTFLTINALAQSDTLSNRILSSKEFFEIVKTHHPLAKQANLQPEKGDQKLVSAKGSLDPKAFADVSQKYYSDDRYYSLVNAGLKIPTYVGIDFYGGLETNDGKYLNPENLTGADGLWYAGVSVPIGQGLFFDKRRSEIQRAKIYRESSEIKRIQLLNKLQADAGKAYWHWFEKYFDYVVYEDAVVKATTRFNAIKQSAKFGDRPSIDTLEAGIQVQNRMLNYQQAKVEYKNARLLLETFLWAEGIVPLELDSNIRPESLERVYEILISETQNVELTKAILNHPELTSFGLAIESFEVDQKLKKEQLKPNLNLKYNLLLANGPVEQAQLSPNNYQWGLEFSMPILLRKERGELAMNKILIEESQYQLESKRVGIKMKAQSLLNELETTQDQVRLYNKTVIDYESLLNGEVRKFGLGESSLFMINSREISYITAQLKYINLVTKNRKMVIETKYSLGTLWQD